MKNIGNIVSGIVLVGIGLIVGLNVLEVTNINIFFKGWWTLLIIIPCFIGIFKDKEKIGSIVGILIGFLLLLSCQNIIDFTKAWRLILPVLLIVIGLFIIFKDKFNSKIDKEIEKINKNNKNSNGCRAIFSEQNIIFDDEKFNGINLTAIFCSIKCDLRKSKIDKDVVINANSIFGGIDIYVPENIKVNIKSSAILGEVDENRKNKISNDKSLTIYVNDNCVLGEIDIK